MHALLKHALFFYCLKFHAQHIEARQDRTFCQILHFIWSYKQGNIVSKLAIQVFEDGLGASSRCPKHEKLIWKSTGSFLDPFWSLLNCGALAGLHINSNKSLKRACDTNCSQCRNAQTHYNPWTHWPKWSIWWSLGNRWICLSACKAAALMPLQGFNLVLGADICYGLKAVPFIFQTFAALLCQEQPSLGLLGYVSR